MKKFTLAILGISMMAAGLVKGQSFSVSNYTPVMVMNDNTQPVESHLTFSNNSSSDKTIQIRRFINVLAPGQSEFFCFGTGCYPPGTDTSNGADVIAANSSDQTFKSTLIPNNTYGYSSLHYRFYDINNLGDSVGVTLAFDFTTSIAENTQNYGLSKPLQNPADAFTVFTYNLQGNDNSDQLVVFNMLGSKIRSMDIPGKNGTLVLSTSDLKAGVYLVSYVSNGKVKDSCRLVVSHR